MNTPTSPNDSRELRCLLECMRYNSCTIDFKRFIEFSEAYSQWAEDNLSSSDKHLAKYLKFLIDTSSWPIPPKQLSRIMEVQDQLMEESILKKSNFVVRDAFDLGLKNYYSHVSSSVSGILKNRGYMIKENSDLLREKEQLVKAKKELVRARLKSTAAQEYDRTASYSRMHSGTQTPSNRFPAVSPDNSGKQLKQFANPINANMFKRKKRHKRSKCENKPSNFLDAYFKSSMQRAPVCPEASEGSPMLSKRSFSKPRS
jgi:hypothetical protein